MLGDALARGESILLEGAHGIMLDTIVGVMKAYTSRVGGGPVPTELTNATADAIRQKGNEYGTTTGRPRRIRWLDLEAVKFCCAINNVTSLVITKLDILSGVPKLQACVGYKLGIKRVHYSACGYTELAAVKPVYNVYWMDRRNRQCSEVFRFTQIVSNVPQFHRIVFEDSSLDHFGWSRTKCQHHPLVSPGESFFVSLF